MEPTIEIPVTPVEQPKPEVVFTPFPDGSLVNAYPDTRHAGQFILADAARKIYAVVPDEVCARLIYEATNMYFAALQMRAKETNKNLIIRPGQ